MPMFKRRSKKEEIDAYLNEGEPDVNYHSMDTGEVISIIDTDPIRGLTDFEVQSRINLHGLNVLVEKGKTHPIVLFFRQFIDVLIGLLFIAALISLIFGDYIDAAVIFAIVIINGVIGFIQEYQSERSLE